MSKAFRKNSLWSIGRRFSTSFLRDPALCSLDFGAARSKGRLVDSFDYLIILQRHPSFALADIPKIGHIQADPSERRRGSLRRRAVVVVSYYEL